MALVFVNVRHDFFGHKKVSVLHRCTDHRFRWSHHRDVCHHRLLGSLQLPQKACSSAGFPESLPWERSIDCGDIIGETKSRRRFATSLMFKLLLVMVMTPTMSWSLNLALWRSSHPWICRGIIVDSEGFAPSVVADFFFFMSIRASSYLLIQTCHVLIVRTFDLVEVFLELPFCLLMVDEYFFLSSGTPEIVQVQCVNSESITITSHPEVFSRRSSETRNQSRNKKAIIIWVRASCTWEHQTHSDQRVLRLHSTLAQSWDCSLAWCCSKTHSTNCSSFGYSFDQSIDYAPFHHALSSGCCCGSCFRRPPGSFLSVFVEREFVSWKVLIRDSWFSDLFKNSSRRTRIGSNQLHTSFLWRPSRCISSQPAIFTWKNEIHRLQLGRSDRDTHTLAFRYPSRSMGSFHTPIENLGQPNSDKYPDEVWEVFTFHLKILGQPNSDKISRWATQIISVVRIMFGSAGQSNQHRMMSQHSEHHTVMPKWLILLTIQGPKSDLMKIWQVRKTLGMTHEARKEKQNKVTNISIHVYQKLSQLHRERVARSHLVGTTRGVRFPIWFATPDSQVPTWSTTPEMRISQLYGAPLVARDVF